MDRKLRGKESIVVNKQQVRKLAAQAGYDVDEGGICLDETSYYSEEALLIEFARLVELATKESAIQEDKLAEFKCGIERALIWGSSLPIDAYIDKEEQKG